MLNAIKIYLLRHVQSALNSLGQLSRSPFASLMTCLVIGISLALPAALFVLLKNAENIRSNFQQTAQITLYLKKDISPGKVNLLTEKLKHNPAITKAYPISPTEGLAELQQQAGFQGATEELKENPLPWTMIIIPNTSFDTSDSLEQLGKTLRQLPEVDNLQIDMLWVKRLGTLLALAKRTVLTLGIFLGLAVLLIINNTIRSATQNSQTEIAIIKLFGGTDAFIRRPFLYAGICYGLLGSIIAWQLVDALLLMITEPAHQLAKLYDDSFALLGLNLSETTTLLGIGMLLGLVGSWVAITQFLKKSA